jgi:hypothetical protein
MELFGLKHEPVFLKEGSSAEQNLEEMRRLLPLATGDSKKRLERDIKKTEAGIFGERQVAFQLKNSHLPIHVIHDLNLEHGELSGQIDFLVLTPYVMLVIECKSLVGNIEITSKGDFIRTFNYGHGSIREGMESPITQNERHLQLMKAVNQEQMGSFMKWGNDHTFRSFYKSVVVLANPKTILDDRHAPADIKCQVIRADALIRYIQELDAKHKMKDIPSTWKETEEMAARWCSRNVERHRDIASEYGLAAPVAPTPAPIQAEDNPPSCPKCGAPMVLRTASRGARAGKKFWGCSTYPHCHGIVNIDG